MNIAKKINDNHQLIFTGLGAPQTHGQRVTRMTIDAYQNHPAGIRYSADNVLDPDLVSVPSGLGHGTYIEDNFYHKPVFSLNHYWTITDKMDLSTSIYHSTGTGGGGGTYGNTSPFGIERGANGEVLYNSTYRTNGYIDIASIIEANQDADELTRDNVSALRASRNDHRWSGVLSTLNAELTDDLNLMVGLDVRNYVGKHFRVLTDLLGVDYLIDTDQDVNDPNKVVRVGDKIDYNNDGYVRWLGGFGQLEYSKDKLSAFATVNIARNSFKRVDHFGYLDSDPLQETDWYGFTAFGIKGGASYDINDNNFLFANLGYFERAPFFDTVFPNFANIANEEAENEKITSYEIGYGYRGNTLKVNINAYWTQWADKAFQTSVNTQDGTELFANITGVDAVHQGVEFDFQYNPNPFLSVNGQVSVADNVWANNVNSTIFDGDQAIETFDLYIKDLKVGNAAQTTAAFGVDYTLFQGFKLGAYANYFDNIYANFEVLSRTSSEDEGRQAWKMESFTTVDLNMVYDFQLGGNDASLVANVYNLFNTEYIQDASDIDGTAQSALVYFGTGTTWTAGIRINF